VYKTLFQDLEKILSDVEDDYVTKLITTLTQYIAIRLQLLELYDKLYEVGSSNNYIDFGELTDIIAKIYNECSIKSPVDGVLRILE